MKSIVSIIIFLLSFSSFANEIELDKSEIRVEIGDITKFEESDEIQTFSFVQTSKTPKTVDIKIEYQKPALECVEESNYVAYPDCSEPPFPDYGIDTRDCDPYVATKCDKYKYDIYSSFRYDAIETIRLKFKKPTTSAKAFEIKLTHDSLNLNSEIIKGDFKEVKVRDKTFIRFMKRVIFKK